MSAEILDGRGRFILLDKPAAYPFKEMVTGTPEGPVFDLSVDFDGFDGVGYIKAEHVIEMAHTLGMSTKEETNSLRAKIAELEEANSRIPKNVEGLINGIGNLVTEWGRGVIDDAAIDPDSGIQDDGETPDSDNSAGKVSESGNSGKSESSSSGASSTADKPAVKNSKSSSDKGPNSFSAGPIDGFGFDS